MPKSPTSSDLISPEYLAEQQRLHADPRGYGGRGSKWAGAVSRLMVEADAHSVLDYGCGQATLEGAVTDILVDEFGSFLWRNYDPAMREFAAVPDPAVERYDLVVSTDMLEHCEPEKIWEVVRHIRSLLSDGGQLFTVISTVPTAKTLSDGRQAHILLRSAAWWEQAFRSVGLEAIDFDATNPKPEKQLVNLWRPI